MKLDMCKWKEFILGRLVSDVYKAKALNKDDLVEADKKSGCDFIRYITRTGENNGCELLVDMSCVDTKYIEEANAITIGDTTATCFYQSERFITGDHMVVVRAKWLNEILGLYVLAILNNEQYKYSYGRAFLMDRIKNTIIKLPVQYNSDGKPLIDDGYNYSDEGYVPDWKWMKAYIESLHHKPLTTKNMTAQLPYLNVNEWKEFFISRCSKHVGLLDIENCKCGSAGMLDEGTDINYIGAKKNDNGVMRKVAYDPNQVSRGNGIMFICDGEGSVGYTNYMDKDFIGSTTTSIGYDENINKYTAMFLVTIFDKERFKYSYGRKYRAHLDEAIIKLPIQCNSDGIPLRDATCKYSNQGYIPDWKFMENYIKALPYGDRI